MATDIRVENHGSIFRFVPVTPVGREFLTKEVPYEARQWFGNGLCVDAGYAEGLLEACQENGHGG